MLAIGQIHIDCFRLRVRRLKRAIRFYSALFGVPVIEELADGELYMFLLADGRKLLIDDIRQADIREPLSRPIAIVTAEDLGEQHLQVQKMNFAYVSSIESGIQYPYFVCRDRDANEFVVAERPFNYPAAIASSGGPIGSGICRAAVPSGDIQNAQAFYHAWLGDNVSCFNVVPKLEGISAASPLLYFPSGNLVAAYQHLQAIGATLHTKMEDAILGHAIRFSDPDGHLMEIIEAKM
ncbi:VOC family protein [Paenibacillus sp. HJGM_3]|uniref:VOC family protein n=1 Tax=Paenibacillus sp. HJGM_3 TaxID=3379816 RepID=UPI00385E61F3